MFAVGAVAASFFLCLLAIVALRPVARVVDLIDRPGGRKIHEGEVPIVGGLAMLIGVVFGIGAASLPAAGAFLASCTMLVTVGLVDDRFSLSPWARLAAQGAAALLIIFGSQTVILSLGEAFGVGELRLAGLGAYVFTALVVMATVNAFNMLDGIDGLAGALALVALGALAMLAADAGLTDVLITALVVVGAVAAFLVSNLSFEWNRGLRCFMGDGGSALLGLAVAWLAIDVSQNPRATVAPVTFLWVLALPVYEVFWTVIRRTVRGVSPFKADTEHLHHVVLRAGFSAREAFGIFATLAAALACVGISLDRFGIPEVWSLVWLAVIGVLVVWALHRAERLRLLPILRQTTRDVASTATPPP